jgi:RTX calcium-binding nonapeptide repeat (4 copies)/PA domain/Bacterial Ig domain
VPLVVAAGDQISVDHDGDPGTPEVDGPASYHSVFVWQDGPRAFLVASDNIELTDVDIFDITNPAAPVQVGDFDLAERFPQILDGEDGRGGNVFHHDMVVKQVGGRPVMLSDYWDAGYVQLDVTDPSNPTLVTDSTFSGEDPLLPGSGLTPEGNAHQGEFSFNNEFLLAADEDFGPYRLIEKIDGQEVDPQFGFGVPVFPDGSPIPELQIQPGDPLAGGTRFIGLGCDPMAIPPPTATATIAVIERGVCGFEVKALNAEDAGYEGFVIFNSNSTNVGCEGLLNMLFSDPTPVTIKGIFVARRVGLQILGTYDPATYTCTPGGAFTPAPADGTEGETIDLAAVFDGWGYAHLYDAKTSEHLDAFAISEGVDERYAEDFGVLSIHEFAADPTEHLAYSAYYAGGMRVFQFDRANGLRQVGAFIAPEGNDFWGVEQFTTPQGERLIAGSDRDFGLYLFRYTGPGAAQAPVCSDQTVLVPFKDSADVPLPCSDANANPLRQTRLSDPAGGTIADRASGGWTYTHTGDRIGPAGSFTFKANDGAADSNVATTSLVAVPDNGGRCANRFVGSNARDVILGSRFGDRISGARGRDLISARGGSDCVSGNRDGDRLLGGRGRDRLNGHSGKDVLFGGPGPDRLFGGPGRDRLSAGGGTNRLFGGGGNDRIRARNNRVDRIRCGAGTDRVIADVNDRVGAGCEGVRRG